MPLAPQSPIRKSLQHDCAERIEERILSGQLAVGQKLPPERELARQLDSSRAAVHQALIELAGKGLLKRIPFSGIFVTDYRMEGSLALLNSLFNYRRGELASDLLDDALSMRMLIELENARLAALHRTEEHIRLLRDLIKAEEEADPKETCAFTALDFEFHHLIALASGNRLYPLLLNSCKPVYTNFSERVYRDARVVPAVIGFHRDLADAVKKQDEKLAMAAMRCLLAHGEELLRRIISKTAGGPLPSGRADKKAHS